MDAVYIRFVKLQKELETDPEYRLLDRRRKDMEKDFFAVLGSLAEGQREAILEYIGICGELGERETEIACFLP